MEEHDYVIAKINDYGSALLDIAIQDFMAAGFALGDVLRVRLENGRVLERVPFFNGYFTHPGVPVMVAYPDFKQPLLNLNDPTSDRHDEFKVGDHMKVSVLEKYGCRDVLDMLSTVTYTNDPGDFKSPEAFANAREVRGGTIAPGKLYRCATPFNRVWNRPDAVAGYLERKGVKSTLSLSESEESLLKQYPGMPEYCRKIYESGCAVPVNLGGEFFSVSYRRKISDALRLMMARPLPCAVHCLEGKDRTGFFCLLLEALMGASYSEMEADYMMTYENYYGINPADAPEKYEYFRSLFFDEKLAGLCRNAVEDLRTAAFAPYAETYLLSGGMSSSEIAALRRILSE